MREVRPPMRTVVTQLAINVSARASFGWVSRYVVQSRYQVDIKLTNHCLMRHEHDVNLMQRTKQRKRVFQLIMFSMITSFLPLAIVITHS